MHIFMDNFCHNGKYSTKIASHQTELRREGNFTDKNCYLFHPCIINI